MVVVVVVGDGVCGGGSGLCEEVHSLGNMV